MNHLHKELAPLSSSAWEEIEEEVSRVLKLHLTGRRFVDFKGPKGWEHSAVGTGEIEELKNSISSDVLLSKRKSLPMIEVKIPFEIPFSVIREIDRGAKDADLDRVTQSAQKAALIEDAAIFHGIKDAGIIGLSEAGKPNQISIKKDFDQYPAYIARAIEKLRENNVEGPYGVVFSPEEYTSLNQIVIGGRLAIEQVHRMMEGPILWSSSLKEGVVFSMRGGDYALTVGEDFSIGYEGHTANGIKLYIQESFTFQTLTPEAAVPLVRST